MSACILMAPVTGEDRQTQSQVEAGDEVEAVDSFEASIEGLFCGLNNLLSCGCNFAESPSV